MPYVLCRSESSKESQQNRRERSQEEGGLLARGRGEGEGEEGGATIVGLGCGVAGARNLWLKSQSTHKSVEAASKGNQRYTAPSS